MENAVTYPNLQEVKKYVLWDVTDREVKQKRFSLAGSLILPEPISLLIIVSSASKAAKLSTCSI